MHVRPTAAVAALAARVVELPAEDVVPRRAERRGRRGLACEVTRLVERHGFGNHRRGWGPEGHVTRAPGFHPADSDRGAPASPPPTPCTGTRTRTPPPPPPPCRALRRRARPTTRLR